MAASNMFIYLAIVAVAIIATGVNSSPGPGSYYANNNTNKSNNLIIGYRQAGDRLVMRQSVVKNSSWMQVVTLERTFNTTRFERITLLQALDQKTNGNGANASLIRGGPGHSNATLRFKSLRGHGINFVVELYAR